MAATAPHRALDRGESFFWFLDRLSSMNFCVIAECQGNVSDEAIQSALDRAQRRHPLLSVAIEADENHLLHFVPRPAQGIPLQRIESADWQQRLAKLNVQLFELGESPLVRAYRLARPNGGWVVALVFHHSIADARSAFHLLCEVLQDAVAPLANMSPAASRPPLMALYPPQFSGEAALALGEGIKAARKELLERVGPPEVQAGHLPSIEAPNPRLLSIRLGGAESESLVRRARGEGTTINGLIGAAQLISLRRMFGDVDPRTLGLTCAADLRPYLRESIDARTPGFYVTLVTSLQRVGDAEQLWDMARHVSASIRQQVKNGVGHLFYYGVPPTEKMPATAEGIETFRGLMAKSPSTSLLSNAGQLPPLPDLPGLAVEALSFALCPTQNQPVFTAVAGHAKGLSINLNHNLRQLSADAADSVASSLQGLLHQVLRG